VPVLPELPLPDVLLLELPDWLDEVPVPVVPDAVTVGLCVDVVEAGVVEVGVEVVGVDAMP
jgi:hypothetical protein